MAPGTRILPSGRTFLRLLVGELIEETAANGAEQVCVLETNLDDTSGEWSATAFRGSGTPARWTSTRRRFR